MNHRLEQLASCWTDGGPDLRARPGKLYKGGGGSSTNTTTAVNYSPEEAARRTQVMDEASNIYNWTKDGVASGGYPGSAPVGQDWNTAAGQDLMRAGAGTIAGQIGATQGAAAEAGADINRSQGNVAYGYNAADQSGAATQRAGQMVDYQNLAALQNMNYGLTGALDVENNPYLHQAMGAALRPLTQAYSGAGGALSQTRSGAQNAGQVGSSRQGIAEGITNRAYMDNVQDVVSKMGTAAYDRGQDTYSRTLAMFPQLMQQQSASANAAQGQAKTASDMVKADMAGASLSNDWLKNQTGALQQITNSAQAPGAMYSAIGAQNENLAQSQEDYAANQRMWQLNAPWIPLQNYASIVYGGSAPSTNVSSTGSAPRNSLGQVVGAGLTAASMYNMMG